VLELSPRRLSGSGESSKLLLVGPSLGTSVVTLWGRTAGRLTDVEVVGWDLPGHGGAPPALAAFSVLDLAVTVEGFAERQGRGRRVHYAGVSLGGAVGLVLATRSATFASIAGLCSAPRIGDPRAWHDRAALVRAQGTDAVIDGSRHRWFAPDFDEHNPGVADVLLDGLRATDPESYALACEAMASFDLSHESIGTAVPMLAVTGAHDLVVNSRQVRDAMPHAEHVELHDCGHLPPAEQPAEVAALLNEWMARTGRTE
jgi:pimeloyl-ACP methyl ester carboxylesterase